MPLPISRICLAIVTVALLVGSVAHAALQGQKAAPAELYMRLAIEGRGNVLIKLFTKEAPQTTSHLAKLVRDGFYDGQRFFRVEKTPRPYLVQIGDPDTKTKGVDAAGIGQRGSGTRIRYEATPYSNVAGMVGLATVSGDRDSGDSQFYILLADAPFLDGKATLFGQVVQGMDVLQKVERADRVLSVSLVERK